MISIELRDQSGRIHLMNSNGVALCGHVGQCAHVALSDACGITSHLKDEVCALCRERARAYGVSDQHAIKRPTFYQYSQAEQAGVQ